MKNNVLTGTPEMVWVTQAANGYMAVRTVEKLLQKSASLGLIPGTRFVAAWKLIHEEGEPTTEEWLAERQGTGEAYKASAVF